MLARPAAAPAAVADVLEEALAVCHEARRPAGVAVVTNEDVEWLEASVQRTLESAQERLKVLQRVSADPGRMLAGGWHDLAMEIARERRIEALALAALTGAGDHQARVGRMGDFIAGMLALRRVPEMEGLAGRQTIHSQGPGETAARLSKISDSCPDRRLSARLKA